MAVPFLFESVFVLIALLPDAAEPRPTPEPVLPAREESIATVNIHVSRSDLEAAHPANRSALLMLDAPCSWWDRKERLTRLNVTRHVYGSAELTGCVSDTAVFNIPVTVGPRSSQSVFQVIQHRHSALTIRIPRSMRTRIEYLNTKRPTELKISVTYFNNMESEVVGTRADTGLPFRLGAFGSTTFNLTARQVETALNGAGLSLINGASDEIPHIAQY